MILDLAHSRLSVEGRLDDGKLVKSGITVQGLAGILGGTLELQGLGEVETGTGAHLAGGSAVGATEGCLAGDLGLLDVYNGEMD